MAQELNGSALSLLIRLVSDLYAGFRKKPKISVCLDYWIKQRYEYYPAIVTISDKIQLAM